MSEVVAKIMAIVQDEERDGHVVEFWVGQEMAEKPSLNQAFAMLGSMDSLQREVYSFLVQWEDGEFTMEPDDALSECLSIFDQYDSAEELGEPLDRQWKTGQVAEGLVTHLVNSNIFGVWRTSSGDDEAPEDDQMLEDGAGGGDDEVDEAAVAQVMRTKAQA